MAQKCGISILWPVTFLYIISITDITYGRPQCSPLHKHCTYILQNNVTKTLQYQAKADSKVEIFLGGESLDATSKPISGTNDLFYHASFTANPDLHKKHIVYNETLANGEVLSISCKILVKFEPVIDGICVYSEENNQYLVNFNVTANPQLTLPEYGRIDFNVNDTKYIAVFSPTLSKATNNSFRLQYQVENLDDGHKIAASLQASNRIGTSSSRVVCPVPQIKEPHKTMTAAKKSQEMTTPGGNVAQELKQCDCTSAGNRLKPHRLYIMMPLFLLFVFSIDCFTTLICCKFKII